MQIIQLPVGGYGGSNCYIVFDPETKEAAVFDPGYPDQRYEEIIKEHDLKVDKIILTHGHFDHIGGVQQLRDLTGAKVYIPEKDADFMVNANLNMSSHVGMPKIELEPAEVLLKEGDIIEIGPKEKLKVIETPGHTPGSASFVGDGFVIVGDVLFEGSIGRTDFPAGSYSDMMNSLDKLLVLPDDYQVLPGHGNITTILKEKTTNPFIV